MEVSDGCKAVCIVKCCSQMSGKMQIYLYVELKLFQIITNQLMFQVAWLHSEKGIIAVYPDMVAQNDRFTSSFDNRFENKI